MDYMRQIKIKSLQTKIDKVKNENTYEKACNFVYKHVKWFYDKYEDLKREIIAADMIYKETDAAYSHNEHNYEANIILEVKQYYVFIFYEYDYSHDSYSTRIQIIRKAQNIKKNLRALTESFVTDGDAYNKYLKEYNIINYNIDYRMEFNNKTANLDITKYNSMLRHVKDSFVKMLAVGLSFQHYSDSPTNTKLQLLYQILCSDTKDETTKSDTENAAGSEVNEVEEDD